MAKHFTQYQARLFYSYSHRDALHRDAMQKSLSLLKSQGYLSEWHDERILPGCSISAATQSQLDKADIVAFLVSQNFIASEECMKEWIRARTNAAHRPGNFRIPIILENCAWRDLLDDDDIKALPDDAQPVSSFSDSSTAWQQVYDGIKAVVSELRNTFQPPPLMLKRMQSTAFLSEHELSLSDIYVFPRLSAVTSLSEKGKLVEHTISNEQELLKQHRLLIHGQEMTGKTALGKFLFLHLVQCSEAVLHLDLQETTRHSFEVALRDLYAAEFSGDYDIWIRQPSKTLIIDNLSDDPYGLDLLSEASKVFSRIVLLASRDIYLSYFRGDARVTEYDAFEIEPLSHVQQEELIRRRTQVFSGDGKVGDATIDHIEDRVNSIIVSEKVVPRYPFFVLCILQTYEAYMPDNLSISSYGHCYHVLIVAMLVKAGVRQTDSDVNSCFNFAEHLAYKLYEKNARSLANREAFDRFVGMYQKDFILPKPTLNRLRHEEYGIVTHIGQFRHSYMYYFFLGRFLARNGRRCRDKIMRMCDNSHVGDNHIILLFTIHHTNDDDIVEELILRSMCALEQFEPAVLDDAETKRFLNVLSSLPKNIMSENTVEEERKAERAKRKEESGDTELEEEDAEGLVNDINRVLKSHKVLGQVLRNKYGNLSRDRIEEIVETITEGGLRLVNSVLADEDEIRRLAIRIRQKYPKHKLKRIENALRALSLIWTMRNIEDVVEAVNVPEIRETVRKVVREKNTPAYDIVGYFAALDSSAELNREVRKELATLLKKHKVCS